MGEGKGRKREAREEASKMISNAAGVPPKVYLINYNYYSILLLFYFYFKLF